MRSRKKRIRISIFSFFALSPLLFTLNTCAGRAPEIRTVVWLIVRHPKGSGSESIEKLSLFANCADEDGFEDVESIYLVNESQELYWKFNKDNWSRRDQGSEAWIGSNGICDPETKTLPRGGFRLICIDRGGERSEKDIQINPPDTAKISLPSASIKGNSLIINTMLPNCVILFYDKSDNPVKAANVGSGNAYTLGGLFGSSNYREATTGFALFAWDEANRIGAYSKKYAY